MLQVPGRTERTEYTWKPPARGGDATLDSLCGHFNSKTMSSSTVQLSLDCTDKTAAGCSGAPVLTCSEAQAKLKLCTGSKSTTNHGLKSSAADLVCGTADECRDKVEECCREQTIAAKYDVVVIGSGLAGSATVAALSSMLSDRGLGETVALVDASEDLVQGGGSTSVHAPGVAWFPNVNDASQAGCEGVLSGKSAWVSYLEQRAGVMFKSAISDYVADAGESFQFWSKFMGGLEPLPVHTWRYPDSNIPAFEPSTILPRSVTGAACWPDYSRDSSTVAGNVFYRGAANGNWKRRETSDWLADLAAARASEGRPKARYPLWTGHTVQSVTPDTAAGHGYVLSVRSARSAATRSVRAAKVVFASGGYGAVKYPNHHLSVAANTGLAWDSAVANGWVVRGKKYMSWVEVYEGSKTCAGTADPADPTARGRFHSSDAGDYVDFTGKNYRHGASPGSRAKVLKAAGSIAGLQPRPVFAKVKRGSQTAGGTCDAGGCSAKETAATRRGQRATATLGAPEVLASNRPCRSSSDQAWAAWTQPRDPFRTEVVYGTVKPDKSGRDADLIVKMVFLPNDPSLYFALTKSTPQILKLDANKKNVKGVMLDLQGKKGWDSAKGASACSEHTAGSCSKNAPKKEYRGIGLDLDPDFATNGHVYVMWVESIEDPTIRITRFTARGFVKGDVSSGELGGGVPIWEDTEPWKYNGHPGGAMVINKLGHIYFGVGDKYEYHDDGDGSIAEDMSRAGGKIHRIHLDGSAVAGNMGATSSDAKALATIFAIGMRNPYTGFFDEATQRLIVGDVGSTTAYLGRYGWEDIHVIKPGGHHGWPACEGPCSTAGRGVEFPGCDCSKHVNPVITYPHTRGIYKGDGKLLYV